MAIDPRLTGYLARALSHEMTAVQQYLAQASLTEMWMRREPLIYSHMATTVAWRDEMQGVTRRQGLFSLTSGTTRQFARQAPSHTGCGQIGCSLPCTAWLRSPGYDLRRTCRDLPDLTCNAAHGGINQHFPRHHAGQCRGQKTRRMDNLRGQTCIIPGVKKHGNDQPTTACSHLAGLYPHSV